MPTTMKASLSEEARSAAQHLQTALDDVERLAERCEELEGQIETLKTDASEAQSDADKANEAEGDLRTELEEAQQRIECLEALLDARGLSGFALEFALGSSDPVSSLRALGC